MKCPVCGGKPEYIEYLENEKGPIHCYIRCTKCDFRTEELVFEKKVKKKLVWKEWNEFDLGRLFLKHYKE